MADLENPLISETPGAGGASVRPLALALVAWVLAFAVARLYGSALPAWSRETATFLSALTLVGLCFALVIGFSRLSLPRNVYLLQGMIGVVLVSRAALPMIIRTKFLNFWGSALGAFSFLNMDMLQVAISDHPAGITFRNAIFSEVTDALAGAFPESASAVLVLAIAQLILAAGLGLWLGHSIDKPGHLLPIALVAGLADIWSVSAGATSVIIRTTNIHYFLLRFPLLGGGEAALPFLVGLTDFLFFGIFYQAAVRFNLGIAKNVTLLGVSFMAAIAGALFFHVGLPVLPFMAVLYLAGNFRSFKLDAEEIRQILIFFVGMIITGFVITLVMNR